MCCRIWRSGAAMVQRVAPLATAEGSNDLGIPTIATTHSDGPRPPVPNDRDQQ